MTSAIGDRERGLTLIELSLVITILGLVASLAWPELRRYAQAISIRTELARFEDRLITARLSAIRDGQVSEVPVPAAFGSASARAVCFFGDGSAQRFQGQCQSGDRRFSVIVEENGRVTVHEA